MLHIKQIYNEVDESILRGEWIQVIRLWSIIHQYIRETPVIEDEATEMYEWIKELSKRILINESRKIKEEQKYIDDLRNFLGDEAQAKRDLYSEELNQRLHNIKLALRDLIYPHELIERLGE